MHFYGHFHKWKNFISQQLLRSGVTSGGKNRVNDTDGHVSGWGSYFVITDPTDRSEDFHIICWYSDRSATLHSSDAAGACV